MQLTSRDRLVLFVIVLIFFALIWGTMGGEKLL
jgi:hypothetical protein